MQANPSARLTAAQSLSVPGTTHPASTEAPQPALQTTKRNFHKLLDTLTRPSNKRPHESSFLPFSGVDSPAKRIRLEARSRLEAAHKAPVSSSSQPRQTLSPQQSLRAEARARVDTQLLRSRLEAARPSSARFRHSDESARPSTPAKEPNYNPYSHTRFLRRLQTYAPVHLWSTKPPPINEVAWSRNGWICVDTNTVVCKGGCEERVVVSLRPPLKDEDGNDIEGSEDLSHEVPEQLVERVEKLLVGGHDEGCLWRTAGGCKDDIYRLPVARQVVWEPELRERYWEHVRAKREGARLPEGEGIECPVDVEKVAKTLPPGFVEEDGQRSKDGDGGSSQGENASADGDALAFALAGWALSQDSTTDYPLATCSACFRRLGLWMYTSAPTEQPSALKTQTDALSSAPQNQTKPKSTIIDLDESDTDESSQSKPHPTNNALTSTPADNTTTEAPPIPKLNLLTSHRDYCPWISPESQYMTGSLAGLAGYEVLARCIENAYRFRLRGEGREVEGGLNSHPIMRPSSGGSGASEGGAGSSETGLAEGADVAIANDEVHEKSKEEQAEEDRARFARLRALTKTLKLKGLRMRLRGKAYN